MGTILPFAKRTSVAPPRNTMRPAGGTIYITTCDEDDGSWLVIHESSSGNSVGFLGTRFAYADADADALARAEACRMDATYLDGGDAA